MASTASSHIDNNLVEALLVDIKALGERDYPEIGVPTFLIGEDCSSRFNTLYAMPAEPDQLAHHLVALAAVLSAARSLLNDNDVGQLFELLADRHFFDCELGPFSRITALHPQLC